MKNKKKIYVLALILLIFISAVFAGGDKEQSSSTLPKKNVGVIYSSFTDKLGSQFQQSLESLEAYFNVDFKFVETGFNQEQAQALVDSLFQTDLDGLIAVSPNVSILESARKAGIAVVGMNNPVDETTAKEFTNYANYIGAIVNDDYNIGVQAADALYAAGCRKICIVCLTPGTSKNHDDRLKGFKERVAEKYSDMIVLAENASRAQWAAAINTFAAAYPEMDGLFMTACNESSYQAIKKAGLIGEVVVATADISESTPDYLDNGTIVLIAGGQYNKIMLAFAALYNYMYDGTRIITSETKSYNTPFVMVKNSADYTDYVKYIDGDTFVYSPEYVASMIQGLNPEITPEKFQAICESYSLEDVVKRMSK